MGEDADFYDREGAENPRLVEKLRDLRYRKAPEQPEDQRLAEPELLARLIDGHAGIDFDSGAVHLEEQLRSVATSLLAARKEAAEVLASEDRSNFALIAQVVAKLRPTSVSQSDQEGEVGRIRAALEVIARLPVKKRNPYARRPPRNVTRQRAVNAVAEYCLRVGLPFVPPRHREPSNTHGRDFHMTEAAYLTLAVLEACGLLSGEDVPDPEKQESNLNARRAKTATSLMLHMQEAEAGQE